MSGTHRCLWLARAMPLLVTLLVLATAQTGFAQSSATDPNFSNVPDMLGGQRHLLRDDDLLVVGYFSPTIPTLVLLQTSDSTITSETNISPSGADVGDSSPFLHAAAALGRMFQMPHDVVATARGGTFSLVDPIGVHSLAVPIPGTPGLINAMIMADFTGDGYADPVISYGQALRIVTAKDVDNFGAGVSWGPERQTAQFFDLAVGDFNGDGRPKVAGVSITPEGAVVLVIHTVDPANLLIDAGVSTTLPLSACPGDDPYTNAKLAAGRFGTTGHDQLLLVYTACSMFSTTAQVAMVDFDASLHPSVKSTLTATVGDIVILALAARTGRLSWFGSPLDQAVVMTRNDSGASLVNIFAFDPDLHFTQLANFGAPHSSEDLVVGNFDRMQPNPSPPPATQRDPNLQLAILSLPSDSSSGSLLVTIYNIDPQSFQPSVASSHTVSTSEFNPISTLLVAGDTQGRSLALGTPRKVTITGHSQPDIVLAIPPMHIDYIRDIDNLGPTGTPSVLNLTVKPSAPTGTAFSTQYTFTSSTNTSAERKHTTSYGVSTKESAEAKFSYGIPDIADVSVDLKAAAEQTHNNSVAKTYNTYAGTSDSLSATTGFADHLFFTESRFNIYYYPILGQTVCPAAVPNCPDDQKLPLHIQFSGVDMVTPVDIDATTQEWYQPVHEPGNVFSYPWSLDQLQQSFANLVPLTTDPAPWRGTDSSTTAYTTTWSQGSGASQTSGSVSTHSIDLSVSVSANASIEGFGIDASAGFEVNTSHSVSTENTSTQTLAASTGIQANKPDFGSAVADNYLYDFAGYVFGQASLPQTLQTIPLQDLNHNPINIQSAGPLVVGFLADPLRQGLPWWVQAYSKPDVGLNHPERWDWSPSTLTASFNFADPQGLPQDQPFYRMKGFFITPEDANGTGPQLTTATAGDKLRLQARVYNFSLADMSVGTVVHVRFYGQVYENKELVGDSFLIGEAVLQPIPGFNSSSTNGTLPNWALASTTFDTTNYADKNLIFWVLVWMEGVSGNLSAELEGHGLTQTPALMTFTQITQVPTELYSNNVGFYGYNTSFYVAAPGSLLGRLPSTADDLALDHLSVPGAPIMLDTKAKVAVTLRTGETLLGGFPVLFYDGDPQTGGKVFDVQHLVSLRANSTHLTRAFFRPQTCGEHTIVVVAGPATPVPATGRAPVHVTINPVASVQALISSTTSLALPTPQELRLVARLEAARRAFTHNFPRVAVNRLQAFISAVEVQRGQTLTEEQADRLIGQAQRIISCV